MAYDLTRERNDARVEITIHIQDCRKVVPAPASAPTNKPNKANKSVDGEHKHFGKSVARNFENTVA